jgi:threonine dehydrogenase-like Zn-dependent dehydrogenase
MTLANTPQPVSAQTMVALVLEGTHPRIDTQFPKPIPGPGEALLQVRQAGVCNTDLELVKGYMGFSGILGHEFVATVTECSDAPHWVGKRVCADINAACELAVSPDECHTCGHPHHCPNRTVIGIDRHHGAFAQYLVAPIRNLYEVPDSVSDQAAVFTEPLAAAFEIAEQISIKRSETIVVLGDGKLGILIAQVMRLHCDTVWLLGRHAGKLAMVKHQAIQGPKVQTALSSVWENDPSKMKKVDIVIEATGSASGLVQAMNLVKPRGTIVLKSTVAISNEVNLAPIVIDEITLLGSRCGPFDKALTALAAKQVAVEPLIVSAYPLVQAEEALAQANTKGTLKILLNEFS